MTSKSERPSTTPIEARVESEEGGSYPYLHSMPSRCPWQPSEETCQRWSLASPYGSPSANGGKGITSGTFYGNLRKYLKAAGLPASGMHIFRHSAAKLRRDSGQTVEEVSRFLDHSSLAVTSVYLRRLEGDEDNGWQHVAQAKSL